jgi:hypothetical protein
LIDTPDFNWKAAFLQNWETTLRATRLVELDARVVITVEDIVAEGYFLKLDVSKKSSNPKLAAFQSMFYARTLQITDPNIVSSQVGQNLQALRDEARERAKEGRRNSEAQAEAIGGLFSQAHKKLGEDREKLTRRDPKNKKPTGTAYTFDEVAADYPSTCYNPDESDVYRGQSGGMTCLPGTINPYEVAQSEPDSSFYDVPPPPVTDVEFEQGTFFGETEDGEIVAID